MSDPIVVRVEQAPLVSRRPRTAGSNARLGPHGREIWMPLLRITLEDGTSGFGLSWAPRERAEALVGRALSELFDPALGVPKAWRAFEAPIWDLVGRRRELPVYAVAAEAAGRPVEPPLSVPCYDTSLYFDDLDLESTEEAAALLAAEARKGFEAGHRAFKIKVGRGARHLPLEEGTRRDIAVVRAVREAVGPEPPILLDANNGYNLNLAKRVLAETADCGIQWLEEAFHEDPVLYRDLKEWMGSEGLSAWIADGEGEASPRLLDWARDGLVDVIQYDVFGYGLTRWLETGRKLDEWGARSAPHHYGTCFGNYVTCHLAPALRGFAYAEWDEARCDCLDASAYRIAEGRVWVPALPGFGLQVDEGAFQRAAAEGGFRLTLRG